CPLSANFCCLPVHFVLPSSGKTPKLAALCHLTLLLLLLRADRLIKLLFYHRQQVTFQFHFISLSLSLFCLLQFSLPSSSTILVSPSKCFQCGNSITDTEKNSLCHFGV